MKGYNAEDSLVSRAERGETQRCKEKAVAHNPLCYFKQCRKEQ